jgi:DNA repair exonuclease SbcCD nuclease subunit
MKILHCADIHLGKRPFGTREFSRKRYEDFFRAFSYVAEKAIGQGAEVLIAAGDLFDRREITPDILDRCEAVFSLLKEKEIRVILIAGNHDITTGDDTLNSWHEYLSRKGLARYGSYHQTETGYSFDQIQIDDVIFWPVGYPGFLVDPVLSALAEQLDPAGKNIVIVHTAVDGSDFLPGLVATETLRKLQGKALYVAGGHFHNPGHWPAENPFFYVPGSPEYWDVRKDRSDKKGAYLFDTEMKIATFLDIPHRTRLKLNFTAQSAREDDWRPAFTEFAGGLGLTGEELVLLNFRQPSAAWVDTAALEGILEQAGALKAYINVQNSADPAALDDLEPESSTIRLMERDIMATWPDFRSPDRLADYLQRLKQYQEEEQREDFLALFDRMLEEEP